MALVHNVAPRVLVYPFGSPAPATEEGWIALAQLAPAPGSPAVFGDGSHPTTRLCAAAVDLICRRRCTTVTSDAYSPGASPSTVAHAPAHAGAPTDTHSPNDVYLPDRVHATLAVLDVGTGTGILARIARARGARFVVGTDIDPVALSFAKAHAQLDRHPLEIVFTSEPPDHWGARFDLVVANILQGPLETLAPALCRALAPDGVLLISGFTRPQVPSLRVLYEKAGVTFRGQSNLEEWVLLTFAAPP
jgi:ribosomal protein L11 methylase PrmA